MPSESPIAAPEDTYGLTTYLTVVDKDRNMVSITSSLLSAFGSGMVVDKAGYFLNNRMAYFWLDPNDVNALAPGKRVRQTINPALAVRNGKPYIASNYTLESFLGKYVAEIAARGGTFDQSEPYEIIIDGMSGLAVDLTGTFLNDPIAGKAIIISPGKDFIVFGLAISNLSTYTNGWEESGSVAFEMLIETIKFKAEVKDE